jgi:hypothetical protein
MMKTLNLNFLKERLNVLQQNELQMDSKGRMYLQTYPAMVAHVRQLTFTSDNLLTTALMIYGWMPTIPVLNTAAIGDLPTTLNKLKAHGEPLHLSALEHVQTFMNNSMVGSSKLLHFVRPDVYPIWDSRISASIGGQTHAAYMGNPRNYQAYMEALSTIIRDQNQSLTTLKSAVVDLLDKQGVDANAWTDMRILEFVLFASAKA